MGCPLVDLSRQSPFISSALLLTVCLPLLSSATSITDIQGPSFLSPLDGQSVSGVLGLVTAKSTQGFYIQGNQVDDDRVSNGLFVFSTSANVLNQVVVGDLITLNGRVQEFRSSASYLFSTEITSPTNITVLSSNNTLTPVVLGIDRSPPTQQLSALDKGSDGFLSVPNNQSSISAQNLTLSPDLYGLDFWASLEAQLVTVPNPTVVDFNNDFGEFWVYGDWTVTGKNSRGGISMVFGPDEIPDANPEVIIVGSPLDGSSNPDVAVGQKLTNITGVIAQQFGFYYVIPTSAPTILSSPSFDIAPTTIESSDTDACVLTVGDYNMKVENMAPTSSHISTVAEHIASSLNAPDIMFLQEIQDNSGPTDDGTVSANLTLTTLVNAIANATGNRLRYNFTEIPPVDGEDGGQTGGNIRVAYLYRGDKLKLAGNATAGGSLDSTSVLLDENGKIDLVFNPGRIDPTNSAWASSRKPLVALWESTLPSSSGERFFTVNLHLTSKGGSSSVQGDYRSPVNAGVEQRTSQVEAAFVRSILAIDSGASIIVGGDCNEFLMTRSVYDSFDGVLTDVDGLAGVSDVERYTYVYDQNNEQLDHLFVSNAITSRELEVEHIHVNNWASSIDARASDHDPSVARVGVC
ncbi:DNase I-like protein [Sanghuangporus baumii]|uniref:DNase I-like protein n=1 Tax=Sanghuangporus baumii TaxID=108892 RepID=A0A9Q5HXB6_SANBA|nr:DNase I-like protein [Sanghuangporus baumii]